MSTPKRGFLQAKNEQWTFSIGRTKRTLQPYNIPLIHKNINALITDNKIVSGWKTTIHMQQLRKRNDVEDIIVQRMTFINTTSLQNLTANAIRTYINPNPPRTYIKGNRAHIDALDQHSPTPTSSLKDHSNMTVNDKSI